MFSPATDAAPSPPRSGFGLLFYNINENCHTEAKKTTKCCNQMLSLRMKRQNKHDKEDLSPVDKDHFEASDGGVHVREQQAGLQHLGSHHARGEGDSLLHCSSWTQLRHPAGRHKILKSY